MLAYTGLGFGDSGCKITLDDPDYDGKAGKQLVERARPAPGLPTTRNEARRSGCR